MKMRRKGDGILHDKREPLLERIVEGFGKETNGGI